MTRRQCLGSLAAVSVLSAQRRRPNVVFLITDDQGYGDLSCHGNPVLKTPNLDSLHARSIRFTQFHVSPTCAPTRAALMTGRFNNATGVWHTINGRSLLAHDEVTMAQCFQSSGYRTGIFGKWHLGDNYPCRPQDRGFDEVLIHGGGGIWQTPDHFGNDYSDDTYLHNGKPEKFSGFCTDVWFDQAMRFMKDTRQPFFSYISTNAPHSPMWAPESYVQKYAGVKGVRDPGFYGMIANFDDNVGRLQKFLRQNQLENDTILIYMTDNGTSDGAQIHNAGMRGQKGTPYEGGHRVPFFVHWPAGGYAGGRDIDTLTAHIDVLPTLVELCDLKRPAGPPLHGRSMRPLLEGKTLPERCIVTDSQRLENLVKWRQAAVMMGQWRLVNPSQDGRADALELYDLRTDPGQKNNVARANSDVVARLKQHYEEWWKLSSARANEYVRIVLGSDRENPAHLTSHDWHGEGAIQTYSQRQIRQGPAANGFWTVDVARAGRYRFELRRWPRELDLALNAPYTNSEPNRETAPGKAIPVVSATISIARNERTKDVGAADKAAVFTIDLPKGPAELRTTLMDKYGVPRGAYYVYVERV